MAGIGIAGIKLNRMVTLLKTLIIVVSFASFVYAANLAMQGDLEMEIIMRDYVTAKAFLLTEANALVAKLDEILP